MRAHFGGYFFGQVATYVYLIQSMQGAEQFSPAAWPQFSLFNLVVANFWPIYWIAFALDRVKLEELYWRAFDTAEARVGELFTLIQLFLN